MIMLCSNLITKNNNYLLRSFEINVFYFKIDGDGFASELGSSFSKQCIFDAPSLFLSFYYFYYYHTPSSPQEVVVFLDGSDATQQSSFIIRASEIQIRIFFCKKRHIDN